jgi:hypothetical protein
VDRESSPRGHEDDYGISALLLETLAGLDTEARQAVTEIVVLHREIPGVGHVAAIPGPRLDRGPSRRQRGLLARTCRWYGYTRRPQRSWQTGCEAWTRS